MKAEKFGHLFANYFRLVNENLPLPDEPRKSEQFIHSPLVYHEFVEKGW